MHNKSTLEDACTRRECSAICPLKQFFSKGKKKQMHKEKHFGRCMHKECFLICPLKHFFSKGKKKTIAQQKHFGNACTRRNVFLLYLEALLFQGKEEKDAHKSTLEEQEEFSYCPLQHFYAGRKKKR
jgi:Fe-S-cluster-containing hydrogenase component 2